MPIDDLQPTSEKGVFFRTEAGRKNGIKPDRQFVIVYKLGGKKYRGVIGWESEGHRVSAAHDKIREFRRNHRNGHGPVSLAEERELAERQRREQELAESARPTFAFLWREYSKTLSKSLGSDKANFKHYLATIADKTPDELVSLDIERIRRNLLKKKRSQQTVKHVLTLINRLVNFGLSQSPPLCPPLKFKIKSPRFDNTKTETLTPDEHRRLLVAIETDLASDPWTGRAMLLALTMGLRKGELLRLQWRDVDLDFGFCELRDTKSGKTHRVPINEAARQIFKKIPRTANPFVFAGRTDDNGHHHPRQNFQKGANRISKAAQLPEGFRPFHGLRHHFATTLANAGTPLYTLQRLLTHSTPAMTQRYAHLTDNSLREASETAGQLVTAASATDTSNTMNGDH